MSNHGVTLSFEGNDPAGFTVNGRITEGSIVNVQTEPNPTHYLIGEVNNPASIFSNTGWHTLQFQWGSLDTWNALELLSSTGEVFYTFRGLDYQNIFGRDSQVVAFDSTDPFYGVRFNADLPAFEVDNVSFSNAVPEPASWAMMIAGFGLIGAAARSRRTHRISWAA